VPDKPHLVARAFDQGAAGYLAKSRTAEEIVTALERGHGGERVRALGNDGGSGPGDMEAGTWPARDHGLSEREAEVLAPITHGYSNQEVSQRCYLSINSIKAYVRTGYRKIGVSRRSQAVAWASTTVSTPDHPRSIIRPGDTGPVTAGL
jgi:NarL family two-component system response regulator LiaR